MRKSLGRVAAATVAVTALTAFGTGIALGDPSTGKTINIWGSNTIQDVFTGFVSGISPAVCSTTYTPSTFEATVGNWNATPIDSMQTPVTGGDTFERPDGSGDGRHALTAAWDDSHNTWHSADSGDLNTLSATDATKHEEITAARSSSLPAQSTWTNNGAPNHLTMLPMSIDAVGVAARTNGTASLPSNLNLKTGALTAIWNGTTFTQVTGSTTEGDVQEVGGYPFLVTGVRGSTVTKFQVVPALPQSGSGTRAFFMSAINETSVNTAIVANETGSVAEEENNASADLSVTNLNNALANDVPKYTVPTNSIDMVPFSGAAVIAQEDGISGNTLGTGTSFPMINGDTLTNGLTGCSAGIGTLQTAQAPEVTFGTSVVGDFARYMWCVMPSSVIVTGNPSGEGALQTWCDQTVENSTHQTLWKLYGFDPISSTFSDNSSNWITTDWQTN